MNGMTELKNRLEIIGFFVAWNSGRTRMAVDTSHVSEKSENQSYQPSIPMVLTEPIWHITLKQAFMLTFRGA
jgi:hypothetical protein